MLRGHCFYFHCDYDFISLQIKGFHELYTSVIFMGKQAFLYIYICKYIYECVCLCCVCVLCVCVCFVCVLNSSMAL